MLCPYLSPYLFNTLDKFQGGGRIVTNLRYADDIFLLATSEAELQELVDRLDLVSLLINVDKSRVTRRHSVLHTHSE